MRAWPRALKGKKKRPAGLVCLAGLVLGVAGAGCGVCLCYRACIYAWYIGAYSAGVLWLVLCGRGRVLCLCCWTVQRLRPGPDPLPCAPRTPAKYTLASSARRPLLRCGSPPLSLLAGAMLCCPACRLYAIFARFWASDIGMIFSPYFLFYYNIYAAHVNVYILHQFSTSTFVQIAEIHVDVLTFAIRRRILGPQQAKRKRPTVPGKRVRGEPLSRRGRAGGTRPHLTGHPGRAAPDQAAQPHHPGSRREKVKTLQRREKSP